MLLDEFAPDYQFSERHATTVHAPPGHVMRAVREVRASEVLLLRELLALRALPGLLAAGRNSRGGDRPLLDWSRAAGFVTLADTDDELVLGIVGRFWTPAGRPYEVADASEFAAFDLPAVAKAVMNLRVAGGPAGPVQLTTETRVTVADAAGRRRFAAYWALIRPGSGFIRHALLQAVRRRAESAAGRR